MPNECCLEGCDRGRYTRGHLGAAVCGVHFLAIKRGPEAAAEHYGVSVAEAEYR